ncbi:hypothetical protein BV25DRAFT_1911876 [Artomyces pyxidatus]|uniref:Uncharacterized protein n=1 Tax=Artomyces pyxidatus TaxID=48021 RepID=A0ACB8TFQ6_9AGAM|nr:hypothetical protein BV25DRAFT_1911876 [Artomyces pyxidatus]
MSSPTHFRVGKGGFHRKSAKRASSTCSSGGFYTSPVAGQVVEYTTPLNISWDTSCMTTNAVDIYLLAPGADTPRIHAWQAVPFAPGSYQTTIEPKWWNSTSSINLQFTIVQSGTPSFSAVFPAGPIFIGKYDAPSGAAPAAADVSKPDGGVTVVGKNSSHHGLSSGKVAAAVIMPLLLLAFLIGAAYLKIKRDRGKEKRKRWSEAVDKRMSTISTDWKSLSAAGANAAIRNSMAVHDSGNRASAFSFGALRPGSVAINDGGQAGIGARTVFPGVSGGEHAPPMSQLRPGLSASAFERVSRVSFAPDTRPSSDARRTVTSRAFHTGVVPPLPQRSPESSTPPSDGTMSPTQTSGPLTLSAEDIQARLSGKDSAPRPSVDEVMPALRMMRTGNPNAFDSAEDPELLLSPGLPSGHSALNFPTPPSPTHTPLTHAPVMHTPLAPASAMSSFMPMQPPVNAMSPDDMLRAYAERSNGPQPPPAAYNGAGAGGMRTLYSPTSSGQELQQSQANRYSTFAEEDAYGGTL